MGQVWGDFKSMTWAKQHLTKKDRASSEDDGTTKMKRKQVWRKNSSRDSMTT